MLLISLINFEMTQEIPLGINTRFVELIDFKGLNNSSFAKSLGVFPSIIGNITGGRLGKPSFELLEKLVDAYPDISAEWLLRGEGPMLKQEGESDPECWQLLERERQRSKRLQEDYDALMLSFQRLRKLNILLDRDKDK
jgi:transcriptional regulator with XRE-family HTH domain